MKSIKTVCSIVAPALGLLVTSSAVGQVDRISRLEKRPAEMDPIAWHTMDPEAVVVFVEQELPQATPRNRKFAETLLERLRFIERPEKVRLTLEDTLHRALNCSHLIRVQSYSPGIGVANVVEAEALFDAVYFMNMNKNVADVPVASQLVGSKRDTFSLVGGIRKLLPTGMQVSTSLNIARQFSDNQFQFINPVYTSAFVAEFTQPLMRNAGIDFNRSQIRISRNDLRVGEQTFKRQVRETLFTVEQFYWALVRTRREVSIRARLLTEFEKIYDFLWQRRDFDTYQIQLSQTRASLEASKADFIRVVNAVYDAEDRLTGAINDPSLNLAEDVEIIPVGFPTSAPLVIDTLAEVQRALDSRSEIIEARLQVDNAKIRVGVSKNQAQPRLDLTFRYTVEGLGSNADDAFDQVTQSDFMQYLVVLDFEVPIGNRGPKAAERRARLLHAQQIAALKAQIEQVILDVNVALRAIQTAYKLIDPGLQSAEANESQVASVIARAERKDFSALNQELGARNALGDSRSSLLAALVQYNVAIIELERAKGTLLEYNNISLVTEED